MWLFNVGFVNGTLTIFCLANRLRFTKNMTNILKGQRIALAVLFENNAPTDCFQVDLQISGIKQPVDFSCFGLDKEQKLTNDAYMTFFNQPKTPCGAVELSIPSGYSAGFL
ncbi:MAG: hypothetical protein RIR39_1822, partial [Pseudomonadota bacterium]